MFQKSILIILTLVFTVVSYAQNHWEALVLETDTFKYLPATSAPPVNWYAANFDDTSWNEAIGGFGYDDDDDNTIIAASNSVYLRKTLLIDTNVVKSVSLNIDYDDGFVAYINGVEVARSSNLDESNPTFDAELSGSREAVMHNGGIPEKHTIDVQLLRNGENTLAIQVINQSIGSSDMSARAFLIAKVNADHVVYNETPDWFIAPVEFTESELPIFIINTNGAAIVDDPKVSATLKVINNAGGINKISDTPGDYDGMIGIELRGETSMKLPKKAYRFETRFVNGENNNVSLLGMPEENDWILYAPYHDKTFMRILLACSMGRMTGQYASRTKLCEVVINDEYLGIYVLMEKIKRDDNRVDIANLKPKDINGDELTGGYILRVDKKDNYVSGFSGWNSSASYNGNDGKTIAYYDPDAVELDSIQKAYIKYYFDHFEAALTSAGFTNPNTGYNKYVNTGSFVDFLIVNELSMDVDNYRFSTYFYKEKDSNGGKIYAGPLWDFDRSFGNSSAYTDGQTGENWCYAYKNNRLFWWDRMTDDPYFADLLYTRYSTLRQTIFSDSNLSAFIDSIALEVDVAKERNFTKWPVLGVKVFPNYFVGETFEDEIDYLKNWLMTRMNWMDTNMEGNMLQPELNISNAEGAVEVNTKVIVDIDLTEEYFNRSIIKKKNITVNHLNDIFKVDSIVYKNASELSLLLSTDVPLTTATEISVSINPTVLNGFEQLSSNVLSIVPSTMNGLPQFAEANVKVFNKQNMLHVRCDLPSALPKHITLYNSTGQAVKTYAIQMQTLNLLPLDVVPGIYIVNLRINEKPVAYKILVGRN